ncbi:MAG: CheR family methyltransferase [Methyloligellaceae bacterium]
MTPQDFAFLRDMLKERSGAIVTEEKHYLLECRLMPVAREHDMESMSDLVAALRSPTAEDLRNQVTEAMTINESFFYRDKTPFENFTKIMMPALLTARATSRRIRIWSAAASTGQEPYSLAMELTEMADKMAGWQTEIIGTDLSGEVLEKAKAGLYSQFEVQRGLPIQLLVKYFNQVGSLWQIDAAIKAMVRYRQFNLLDAYAGLGTFDVIFCRNVLIYFDPPTKKDILNRLASQLQPDGYLVLGAAETVIGLTDEFQPVKGTRGLYSRDGGGQAATHTQPGSMLAAS